MKEVKQNKRKTSTTTKANKVSSENKHSPTKLRKSSFEQVDNGLYIPRDKK